MPPTIACEPGEVLLIPFPFTDFSTLKQRPCVVISSAAFNASHSDVIVAAITSRIPPAPSPEDCLLTEAEQKACGLPLPSLVKLGKIVTIDWRLVRSQLGRLPPIGLRRVLLGVRKVLGQPPRTMARR
jgi:mRNA-degrading endonuclease toxin of MazEF toxin-antitoxin module